MWVNLDNPHKTNSTKPTQHFTIRGVAVIHVHRVISLKKEDEFDHFSAIKFVNDF